MKAVEKVPHGMRIKNYYEDTIAPMVHVKYRTIKSNFTNVCRKVVIGKGFVFCYFGK
jgi:hypothetical protein